MSIQITITADTAADTVQLVQDLASVLASMDPADIPMKTEVDATEKDKPKRQPKTEKKQAKEPEEPEVEVVESNEEISDVELRKRATAVSKAGKRDEVKDLVASFGVPNLTAIPQNKRAEFIEKLESL